MRRFVIGDIHGAHKALVQVLKKSKFDRKNDLLICLGDVCDGWPFVKDCIDELMTIENLVYVWGNHDEWAHDWMTRGEVEYIWWSQGGKETYQSFFPEYDVVTPAMARLHKPDKKYAEFFDKAVVYHVIDDEKSPDTVFVHGGFNRLYRIEEHTLGYEFTWDRELINSAIAQHIESGPKNITQHKRVFVGHTALKSETPMKFCEVWNIDTGAGWNGTLSMMDIDTEEIWSSSKTTKLYKNESGRR